MVRVKICGITTLDDARAAAGLGADALGFVLAESPRRVAPEQVREIITALPALVTTVGVFVNEDLDEVFRLREFCGLDAIQLHGDEDPGYVSLLGRRVIKALPGVSGLTAQAERYPMATLLVDASDPEKRGGTGSTFDWERARRLVSTRRVIVAGGLNPDNVEQAVQSLHPYAVDASSGLEAAPGRKDHGKIARFIARAKGVSG